MKDSLFLVVLPICTLGAIFIVGVNISKRYITKFGGLSALQAGILTFGSAAAVFALLYAGLWGLTLPKVLPRFWLPVTIGLAVNVAIQWLGFKAASLDAGEVSLTAPLQAMTPGLITLLALTLGEIPGKTGLVGIGLMMCGSYVLTWDKSPKHWMDYLGPLRRLRLLFHWQHVSPEERNKTLVVLMALGSAAGGTIGLLCDGLYTRRGVTTQGLVLAAGALGLGLAVVYLVWYLVAPDAKSFDVIGAVKKPVFLLPRRGKFIVPVAAVVVVFGLFWVAHVLAVHSRFNHSFVAYVGTLKRFSIILAVPLGSWLFGEGEFRKRMWAAGLIAAGAILISLDGLPARLTDKVELLGL